MLTKVPHCPWRQFQHHVLSKLTCNQVVPAAPSYEEQYLLSNKPYLRYLFRCMITFRCLLIKCSELKFIPLKFLALIFVLASNNISIISLDFAQCKGVPPSLISFDDSCFGYIWIISFTHLELEEDAA